MSKRKAPRSGETGKGDLVEALKAMLVVLDWQKQLVCWALDTLSGTRAAAPPLTPGREGRPKRRPGDQ